MRGRDLSAAEPLATLGRANAGREWPCGGLDGILELALAGDSSSVALLLGRSHARRVGTQIGGGGREWLGGIETT